LDVVSTANRDCMATARRSFIYQVSNMLIPNNVLNIDGAAGMALPSLPLLLAAVASLASVLLTA
jgi:hypothetical protein